MRAPLPIDPHLPDVTRLLREGTSLVIEAPTGSGKTTRVPPSLLDADLPGEVYVLEPRRIAARMAARRAAEERGEEAGRTVGFKVRFDECGGRSTRLWYVTEGVLVRRLVDDPLLSGISTVVLDEFHERSLHADVALALLRRLQRGARPDLRLVAMSATLDASAAARYLGDAPVVRAAGRLYDVDIDHLVRPDDRPLSLQVAAAVEQVVARGPAGDCLVFLPGAAEIRQARDACEPVARRTGFDLVPLHGDLSPAEQDRAVRPSDRPRVILATNVAETSVTIDGVVAVIDSGLSRVSTHSPWSGIKSLEVRTISRASAEQRAGRAGRTRPGRCLRLYTQSSFDRMAPHDVPEIARADLAETVLSLRTLAVEPADLDWLEPPPRASLAAADTLLRRLGALDDRLAPTPLGRSLLKLPIHPRLARLVFDAAERGLLAHGCGLAALLAERDVRRGAGARALQAAAAAGEDLAPDALSPFGFLDPIEALQALATARSQGSEPAVLRRLGLEPSAVSGVERATEQIRRLAASAGLRAAPGPLPAPETCRPALSRILLAAWPDRVGRARRAGGGRGGLEFALATGGTADLPDAALLPEGRLLVAVEAAERHRDRGTTALLVRAAVPVDADDVMDVFLDAVREVEEVRFVASGGRVEATRRVLYEGLVLEERPWPTPDPAAVSRCLADAARSAGPRSLAGPDEDVDAFLARVAFLASVRPDLGLPAVDDAFLSAAADDACQGRRTLGEVRTAGFIPVLLGRLTRDQRRELARLAPESVRLPGGRSARIDYAPDRPPSIASRLQDFFGMARGPAVLDGAMPLVLHLRSPGGKDVQVTTDLTGFWDRHYPAIARELRRRYPRHAWPDDPANARPPGKGRTV